MMCTMAGTPPWDPSPRRAGSAGRQREMDDHYDDDPAMGCALMLILGVATAIIAIAVVAAIVIVFGG